MVFCGLFKLPLLGALALAYIKFSRVDLSLRAYSAQPSSMFKQNQSIV